MSMRHVDGGCPNESTAMGPIANQEDRGGTDEMVSTLARTPRTGTRSDSNSSPSLSLQRRLRLSVKRSNARRFLNRSVFLSSRRLLGPDPLGCEQGAQRRRGDPPLLAVSRWVVCFQWPVTMIDGFPPAGAGGAADPGVQMDAPPPPPAADSGVQISPRVAATPS